MCVVGAAAADFLLLLVLLVPTFVSAQSMKFKNDFFMAVRCSRSNATFYSRSMSMLVVLFLLVAVALCVPFN